jgi:ubiquinone/menaquinone biosynthesis C-methylase UbiE
VNPPTVVRVVADLPLAPAAAFDQVVDELAEALARLGLRFDRGEKGSVSEGEHIVGRVRSWRPGIGLALEWTPTPWDPEQRVEVEIRFLSREGGCQVEVEQRGSDRIFRSDPVEWTGWVASAVVAPFLRTITPSSLGDWLTDRAARRPSGPGARANYANPVYHRPNFRLLLETLRPGPSDRLLDVGCGGGAFLKEVLDRGSRAVGVDHSPEMVRLATDTNRSAVEDGRLQLLESDSGRLPVSDAAFTIAMSTGAFGFFPRPLDTLREMRRALIPGGRMAVFAGTKELAGTPACPEPMASRMHFFEDEELAGLARDAGFVAVEVLHPSLRTFAEESGVPPEGLDLFNGTSGSQLLLGRRPVP